MAALDSAGSARPFRLFGRRERAALAAAAEERVRAWAAQWLPRGAAPRAQCVPAPERASRLVGFTGWGRLEASQGAWLALPGLEPAREGLALAICGAPDDDARSALALEAAGQALQALAAAILGAPAALDARRGREAEPDPDAWSLGSPAMALRLELGAAESFTTIEAVTHPGWALRVLEQAPRPAPARLAERRQALGGQRIELRVLAGSVELDVRSLRELAVGNVIALDTRIDEPMAVVVAGGAQRAACVARLGSLEGRKAVAVGAHASPGR